MTEPKTLSAADWIWMPHPAHFACAFDCRFHLATKVGRVIVSTVGEYFPDSPVREIYAKIRGVKLTGQGDIRKHDYMQKIGFEEIGFNRTYETMVFLAVENKAEKCCPWTCDFSEELDFSGYKDPGAAYEGHLALCHKWSKK